MGDNDVTADSPPMRAMLASALTNRVPGMFPKKAAAIPMHLYDLLSAGWCHIVEPVMLVCSPERAPQNKQAPSTYCSKRLQYHQAAAL